MSWQLASFIVLAAVLLGGFAWYERSRPSSQLVALVAAMAALAVAGRVAFAAIPNVVATTDIAIFTGFALGPAPGFAVGALAGLVSNFWLGQGPWTPWQMVAWGSCGVLGAALAAVRPRAGRIELAAICALAGVLFGALMNFSLMATYGGELSWERFLALQSRAVPFDAAHAIGNAAIALAAGPALVRMLRRFRNRFEWRAPAVASLLLLALAAASVLPESARAADVKGATSWLVAEQNADGGWGASPDRESAPDITAWSMLGLAATGRNPYDVVSGRGRNPVDYLRANVDELKSPGDLARTIVALHSAGADPRSFGGRDLVEALVKRRAANGSYQGWPGSTAFAIIALRVGGASGQVGPSIQWLAKVQNEDGGWGDTPGSPSTPDGTGIAMQAMPDTDAAKKGLTFLRRAQRPSGGFALGGFAGVNSQSTAWAAQGIKAVGTDPASVRTEGKSPLDYLTARQESAGWFRYSPSSDQTSIWVTGQALAIAAGKAMPIAAPPRKPKPPKPKSTSPSPPASGSLPSFPETPLPSAPSLPESSPPPLGGSGAPLPLPGPGAEPPPGTLPEGEPLEPAPAPILAAPAFEASENPGPRPAVPIGIGLGTGGLALGGVIFFGRRFGW